MARKQPFPREKSSLCRWLIEKLKLANGIHRLRLLAGPNGSGKSFLMKSLADRVHLGKIVNADDLEADLRQQPNGDRRVDLSKWGLNLTSENVAAFWQKEEAANRLRLPASVTGRLRVEGNILMVDGDSIDSYISAGIADLLRYEIIAARRSLLFETVMSHPSKLDFVRDARDAGYRSYLYYVSTEDPAINIGRVKARVAKGGHGVSDDKVRDRYCRSLELLKPAVKIVDRAYLFDNSGSEPQLVAEVKDGREVTLLLDYIPNWVNFYLLK